MLDKSVPYAGLYMLRKADTPVVRFPLPAGFRFTFYNDGDEADWARIETSVLEFDSVFSALMLYKDNFLPHVFELRRRCMFIENSDGRKVATSTAWWRDVEGQRRPWLHWVAVEPLYQGIGLGKAIISRVIDLMIDLDGEVDFYLSTQTWSYKAVGIYKAVGFQPTDEKALYKGHRNNYRKAIRILRKLEV